MLSHKAKNLGNKGDGVPAVINEDLIRYFRIYLSDELGRKSRAIMKRTKSGTRITFHSLK